MWLEILQWASPAILVVLGIAWYFWSEWRRKKRAPKARKEFENWALELCLERLKEISETIFESAHEFQDDASLYSDISRLLTSDEYAQQAAPYIETFVKSNRPTFEAERDNALNKICLIRGARISPEKLHDEKAIKEWIKELADLFEDLSEANMALGYLDSYTRAIARLNVFTMTPT